MQTQKIISDEGFSVCNVILLYYFCSFVINNGPDARSPGRFNRRQPKWGQAIYLLYTHTRKDFVTFFLSGGVFLKKKKRKKKYEPRRIRLTWNRWWCTTNETQQTLYQSIFLFFFPLLPSQITYFFSISLTFTKTIYLHESRN